MRLRFTLQHFYNFYNEKQENKNILSCFKMYMLVYSFLFCIANSSIFRSVCVCARARGGGERIKKANVLKGFVFCVLPSTLVAFCLVSACACLCPHVCFFCNRYFMKSMQTMELNTVLPGVAFQPS